MPTAPREETASYSAMIINIKPLLARLLVPAFAALAIAGCGSSSSSSSTSAAGGELQHGGRDHHLVGFDRVDRCPPGRGR